MKEDLKLFVWERVLCNYGPGIAFAFAKNEEEARECLINKHRAEYGEGARGEEDFLKSPKVFTEKVAFFLEGYG